MSTFFESLEEALTLAEQGRLEAAKSVWGKLTDDFRKRVLQFCLHVCESGQTDFSEYSEGVVLSSPYGEFSVSAATLTRLKTHLPTLVASR